LAAALFISVIEFGNKRFSIFHLILNFQFQPIVVTNKNIFLKKMSLADLLKLKLKLQDLHEISALDWL
jgi:hypothetical protein